MSKGKKAAGSKRATGGRIGPDPHAALMALISMADNLEHERAGSIADAILTAGWRPPATMSEQLAASGTGIVVNVTPGPPPAAAATAIIDRDTRRWWLA